MSKKYIALLTEGKTYMYCGPDIPGVAADGLLFKETPPMLKKYMEECPALKIFVVEPKDYGRIRKAISTKGSIEHTQYKKAFEYLQKRR